MHWVRPVGHQRDAQPLLSAARRRPDELVNPVQAVPDLRLGPAHLDRADEVRGIQEVALGGHARD